MPNTEPTDHVGSPLAQSLQRRRELSRSARDAFPAMGVYAIRDALTHKVYVRSSRNVPGAINRIQFELRMGSHLDKTLQTSWHKGGASVVTFETLELLKQRSDPDFDYGGELKMLEAWYRDELNDSETSA